MIAAIPKRRGRPPKEHPKGKIVRYPKALFFKTIGYEIYSEEVRRMHEDESSRVIIIGAPARTSKSFSTGGDVGAAVFPKFLVADSDGTVYPMPPSASRSTFLVWIVAPDFKLAKEFDYLFTWFVDQRERFGWGYEIEKAQNSPETGSMKFVINWGRDWRGNPVRTIVEAKSEGNERGLQAEEVDIVVMSEAADQNERTWAKYLSTRYGRAYLPTTPKVKAEWIRKMIEQGATNPNLRIAYFSYDGRCNPTYDWQRYWMEHAKAESRCVAPTAALPQDDNQPPSAENGHDCFAIGDDCWASRDPHFAEQFMGRWTYAESRVLAFRWRDQGGRKSHILPAVPAWVKDARKYVSTDYGYTDPAAAAWYAIDHDGTIVKFDELYESGLTSDVFAQKILERSKKHGQIHAYLADPKKPEVLKHFQRLRLPVLRVDKARQSDRQAGFMAINDALSDDPTLGRPKYFITANCRYSIEEMRLLHRKDGHTGDEFSTSAIKGADHQVDCDRYFMTAYPRGESAESRASRLRQQSIFEMAEENARRARELGIPRKAAVGGVPGVFA